MTRVNVRCDTFHATPKNVKLSVQETVFTPDWKSGRDVYSAWSARVLPGVGDVKLSVQYGELGTEFTGTYAPGGGGSGMSKGRVVNA